MRRACLLLALLVVGACNVTSALDNVGQSASAPDGIRISVASDGGRCAFFYDGEGVTVDQLLERSAAALRAEVKRQGGPANVRTLPPADLDLPDELPFRCAGEALVVLWRSGLRNVRLSTPMLVQQGGPMVFNLSDPNAPSPVLAIRAQFNRLRVTSRGLVWNGGPIDWTTLRQYLELTTTIQPQPLFAVEVTPDVPVRDLASVFVITRAVGLRALELRGPSHPLWLIRPDAIQPAR